MTFIVGLTGGIGSGKSVASHTFETLGITVVDTDVIARELVQAKDSSGALNKIREHFGDSIIGTDGELNRQQLRKSIFEKPEEKTWLENLLHPLVRSYTTQRLVNIQSRYGVLVSPLLFESIQHHPVNRALVIDCIEATQQQRTSQRDNVSIESVQDIMATQLSREERNQLADDVI